MIVIDGPWGLFDVESDFFDPTDPKTKAMVFNMGKIAQQRLSPEGVICVYVPPFAPCVAQSDLKKNPNKVMVLYVTEFTRCVRSNVQIWFGIFIEGIGISLFLVASYGS
jgi:hypothetical protein